MTVQLTSDLRPVEPHAQSSTKVLSELQVTVQSGLSVAEAARRGALFGPNELAAHATETWRTILLHQIWSPVVGLLAAAMALSAGFGDWLEALAILLVLAINTAIGFVTESRAQRSMEALRKLGAEHQRVRREGRVQTVSASVIVPGDIVLLEEGDVATADMRLVEAKSIAADESTLTGESVPVSKTHEPIAREAALADRVSMIYKGTAITRGSAVAVVTMTGTDTEVGHIAKLAAKAKPQASPLTRKLAGLSSDLIGTVLAIAGALAVAGIIQGHDPLLMVKAGISLAVAAIPEGLPVVATLVLARGLLHMAEKNAVIERLSAVETLGATTVILTDKTGTLTENKMTVSRVLTPGRDQTWPEARDLLVGSHDGEMLRLLSAATLCNSVEPVELGKPPAGDPMERAIVEASASAGLPREKLLKDYPEVGRISFDSVTKIMATAHRLGPEILIAVKGAPEAVLVQTTRIARGGQEFDFTETDRSKWLERIRELGRQGLRVLAIAEKRAPEFSSVIGGNLTFLGVLAFEDPPRADVPEAIRACQSAGIKVVMVTGDHAETAAAIAKAVGFESQSIKVVEGHAWAEAPSGARGAVLGANILARVTPSQKLDLVEAYQAAGHVVAMTGDGVNDAPALKKADIGIAMGLRGTEVARQAAAMVLRDDSFATIVDAVRQGRVIYGNIRRFILYLLACNLSEVLVVSLAVLTGLALPLQPIQILFMNVVTDVFPALALAMGEGSPNVLKRPPRNPKEPLIARRHWIRILTFGLIITISTLAAMQLDLYFESADRGLATTTAFITLALAQLWFVFNMIEEGESVFRSSVTRNKYAWAAIALCGCVLLAATTIEPLGRVLRVTTPDAISGGIAVGASLLAFLAGALALRVLRRIGH